MVRETSTQSLIQSSKRGIQGALASQVLQAVPHFSNLQKNAPLARGIFVSIVAVY
jgi:hypothetical protein